MKTESEFIKYIRTERDSFVNKIISQNWNTEMRTASEDLLIAYDQMVDRLRFEPYPSPQPNLRSELIKTESEAIEWVSSVMPLLISSPPRSKYGLMNPFKSKWAYNTVIDYLGRKLFEHLNKLPQEQPEARNETEPKDGVIGLHTCKYCGCETTQPDSECWKAPDKQPLNEVTAEEFLLKMEIGLREDDFKGDARFEFLITPTIAIRAMNEFASLHKAEAVLPDINEVEKLNPIRFEFTGTIQELQMTWHKMYMKGITDAVSEFKRLNNLK